MSNTTRFLEEFAARDGFRGRFNKRLFAGMLAGFQAAVQDMEQLCSAQSGLRQEIAMLAQENKRLREALSQLQGRTAEDALLRNLETLNVNMRNNNAQIAALESDSELCKAKLTGLERSQRSMPTETQDAPDCRAVRQDMAYAEMDYFDFENHFRGTIAQIKEAQRMYLPYFRGKRSVLDIGCGRGEFLSLLKEEGIPAQGVDVYEPYIDCCRMHGLDAECGDGIAHLAGMDSVDGIFVGQVAEHLQTSQLAALCNTAYEKLTDGGCIVIETPNPTSLAIYTGAFYIDPSHVRPVHPLTLQYFLEKAGFRQMEIRYPESSRPPVTIPPLQTADAQFNEAMQKVSEVLFGCQDYAIVAVK